MRRARGLSAAFISKAKPGRYGDGDGLYLLVRENGAKFWTFRYTRDGRMREKGLGPVRLKSLSEARDDARELFRAHRAGRDPLAEAAVAKAASAVAAAKATTFRQEAERYIEAQRAGWRSEKHAAQWEATLDAYAYETLGKLPVGAIDTPLVLKVLEPIWTTKPETASRLRQRIEAILDAAKARGLRVGDNPAAWRGNLDALLPKREKVRRVKHHAALPYAETGAFVAALRDQPGIAARLMEFTILTAARTGEATKAKWYEIDFAAKTWTVPAERMKAHRAHRVPLAPRALAILSEMKALGGGDYVFPGAVEGQPLSNMAMLTLLRRMKRDDITVHGFRSSFRDWVSEQTSYPRELAELALAHRVGSDVERAYARSDLFDKRRRLMTEWATFCGQPATPLPAKVVRMRRA